MTDEEIAVELKGLQKDVRSLEKRMNEQEKQNDIIQNLVISVKELAINMRQMLDEQKEQGKRLDALEREPTETYNLIKSTVLTAIASGIVGIAIGNLF